MMREERTGFSRTFIGRVGLNILFEAKDYYGLPQTARDTGITSREHTSRELRNRTKEGKIRSMLDEDLKQETDRVLRSGSRSNSRSVIKEGMSNHEKLKAVREAYKDIDRQITSGSDKTREVLFSREKYSIGKMQQSRSTRVAIEIT